MIDHDVAFLKNDEGWPDLEIVDGDLAPEIGLQTAALISLFTDGLISLDDLQQGDTSRRGWWADLISDPIEDQIGSRIWLTDRAKVTQATVNRIIDLSRESLQWMLDDGVAKSVIVTAQINTIDNERIDWRVEIYKPDGNNFFFKFVWDGQQQIGFG